MPTETRSDTKGTFWITNSFFNSPLLVVGGQRRTVLPQKEETEVKMAAEMNRAKGFITYSENEEQIALLSDEEAGQLYKALIAYQARGEESELPPIAKIMFSLMKRRIDENNERYDEKCRRLEENRRKREEATEIETDIIPKINTEITPEIDTTKSAKVCPDALS